MNTEVTITIIVCITLVLVIFIVRAARFKVDTTFDGDVEAHAKADLALSSTRVEAGIKACGASKDLL